jgi:hypothetical protein
MKVSKRTSIEGIEVVQDVDIKVSFDVEYNEWTIKIGDDKLFITSEQLEVLSILINKISIAK